MWSLTGITYRVCIVLINILFPPLAVMMLAGPGYDVLINLFFFLLAVIPAHIHGFYISCVYFHRRHKVKKGRYPGGRKTLIESKNVLNGGASEREVERLYWKEKGGGTGGNGLVQSLSRRLSRSRTRSSIGGENEMMQRRGGSRVGRNPSVRREGSRGGRGRSPAYDWVARDGYGPPPQR